MSVDFHPASDYLLRYRPDVAPALVEAKASYLRAADGLQQILDAIMELRPLPTDRC